MGVASLSTYTEEKAILYIKMQPLKTTLDHFRMKGNTLTSS